MLPRRTGHDVHYVICIPRCGYLAIRRVQITAPLLAATQSKAKKKKKKNDSGRWPRATLPRSVACAACPGEGIKTTTFTPASASREAGGGRRAAVVQRERKNLKSRTRGLEWGTFFFFFSPNPRLPCSKTPTCWQMGVAQVKPPLSLHLPPFPSHSVTPAANMSIGKGCAATLSFFSFLFFSF